MFVNFYKYIIIELRKKTNVKRKSYWTYDFLIK